MSARRPCTSLLRTAVRNRPKRWLTSAAGLHRQAQGSQAQTVASETVPLGRVTPSEQSRPDLSKAQRHEDVGHKGAPASGKFSASAEVKATVGADKYAINDRYKNAHFQSLPEWHAGLSQQQQNFVSEGVRHEIEKRVLDPIYLRDMCSCELCVDPSSGQKKFWTTDIPENIRIAKRENVSDGGGAALWWQNDVPGFPTDHVTRLPDEELRNNLFDRIHDRSVAQSSWTLQKLQGELVVMDYEDYVNNTESYRTVLRAVRDNGLVILKNVPESEDSVVNIAQKIGPLRNSFYGMTWDVRSVPKANNVAYTAEHLGFHMDLLYMKDPPKLQFLHCLRSSAEGGASLFSDSYQAVKEMVADGVCTLETLASLNTVFRYNKGGKYYKQVRTFLDVNWPAQSKTGSPILDPAPFLSNVNWSPPFQGPFGAVQVMGNGDSMALWHRLSNEFRKRSEKPANVYERKLKPGECVIFDNRRVLHARTAFNPGDLGKERWLKGCYVDADPYHSELSVHEI